MPAKAIDEILVTWLRANCPSVSNRVYHQEVWQNEQSTAQYPCIVYEQTDDTPDLELSGESGRNVATFEVTCLCSTSADLRELAALIKTLNSETQNDALNVAYDNFAWITVDSDSELNEFAIEMQEKGYKTTVLLCTVDHWNY